MLRLLFTTEDQSHQLTVITDGIDSQLNVFTTETCRGDIDYYAGLGIVIEPGKTYNLGLLKQWAQDNLLILKSYPEGANAKEIILVDKAEITYEYTLTVQPTSLSFVVAGETKTFTVTSTKQKKVNGVDSGDPEQVTYTTAVSGTGFSKGANNTTVVAAVNSETFVRSGSVTITQSEPSIGAKTVTITLSQEAAIAAG